MQYKRYNTAFEGLKAHNIWSILHWNIISMVHFHPLFVVLFKFYIKV
jgi:hypothetical protein